MNGNKNGVVAETENSKVEGATSPYPSKGAVPKRIGRGENRT